MYFKSEESREKHALSNKGRGVKERNIREYDKNPSYCKQCEGVIHYDKRTNKFCCGSCSTTYTNYKRSYKKEIRTCLWCGVILTTKNAKSYCSRSCQKEYDYHNYINKWKLGIVDGVRGNDGVSPYIRRYMFEKHNSKCQQCSWGVIHPITKKIPLTIHHKDGDCKMNLEYNLELLCPNCHCLTETYGSLNTGNSKRIKRYK